MIVIGNEKTNIEKKELERLMMDATMQLLLSPDSFGVASEYLGEECIDSVDCFTIKLVLPSGIRWFQYYDVETGLKFKEPKKFKPSKVYLIRKLIFQIIERLKD